MSGDTLFRGIALVVSLVGAVLGFLNGAILAEYFGWKVLLIKLLVALACAVIGYYAMYRLILGIKMLVYERIMKAKEGDEQKDK